jgi:hypothetical protein
MAKASKHIARTRKTRKTISTVKQAITAYGGLKAVYNRFMTTEKEVQLWIRHNVPPRGHQLGMYLG